MDSFRPALLHALASVLVLTVLCAVSPVAQSTETRDEGWSEARSPHFTVYTDTGPVTARKAALHLETLRGFLVEIAPTGRFDHEVPFRVYLFSEPDDLAPFQPGAGLGSAGFVLTGDGGVYGATVWSTDRGVAARFLTKQYITWVLNENLPELPEWFRRGLVDYYSTFEVVEGEAHLGKPVHEYLRSVRLAVETPPRQAVGEGGEDEEIGDGGSPEDPAQPLFTFDHSTANTLLETPQSSSLSNPREWLLVHYLLLGDGETRQQVRPYLRRLARGEDPEAAFRGAFGVGVDEMGPRLKEYAQRDRHPFLRLPLSQRPASEVTVQPMSEADTEAQLGALRLQAATAGSDAVEDAEAHFRRALSREPGHPVALAGMADLAAQRGELHAATAGYRRAIEARPDDPLLHFRLGEVLLRSLDGRRPRNEADKARLETALAALRRTTELAPAFPAGWERLGYALTLAPAPSQEAVTALERAAALRPRRVDVVSNLLLAKARVGDRPGVGEAMARLRELGADPATLARGREIELRLMLHQGQALARSEQLDDAVALYAQVITETKDQALEETASRQLEFIATVTQRNLYASLYQRASGLIDAAEPEAAEAVRELLDMARPGLQREAAEALADRLDDP